MCGSRKAPKVVERDPVAEQKAAEAEAATAANLETANRRKNRRRSNLLGLGADGLTGASGVQSLLAQAQGKSTLGGG